MNKYKVEFVHKEFFVFDVLANNEEEARKKASDIVIKNGLDALHENRDPETEIDTVYDVTNTDDPFNAE